MQRVEKTPFLSAFQSGPSVAISETQHRRLETIENEENEYLTV